MGIKIGFNNREGTSTQKAEKKGKAKTKVLRLATDLKERMSTRRERKKLREGLASCRIVEDVQCLGGGEKEERDKVDYTHLSGSVKLQINILPPDACALQKLS